MDWQNGFPKAHRIRGSPRCATLTHHFSHHQEAFPPEKKLKFESMKLPAGVIYNSLWCGIFKDTFSKGWPGNSKMLQHVPHLIDARTLPFPHPFPYSTFCWMLRINLVFQAVNSLFICRIFSEFYLRWKFLTWNLIKFLQKSLWIFYIAIVPILELYFFLNEYLIK